MNAILNDCLALLASDDDKAVARARTRLRSLGATDIGLLLAAWPQVQGPAAAQLARVLGHCAEDFPQLADQVRTALLGRLAEGEPRLRRFVVAALARCGRSTEVESAVLALLPGERRSDQWRALVACLGRVGGAASVAALEQPTVPGDALAAQVLATARLDLARGAAAGPAGKQINDAVPLPRGVDVLLRCRAGIEAALSASLPPAWLAGAQTGAGTLRLRRYELPGDLTFAQLLGSSRLFSELGLVLPAHGRTVEAVAKALCAPLAQQVLGTLSLGTPTWRIDAPSWHDADRKHLALRVQELAPALVNQPRQAAWQINPLGNALLALPALSDPRWAWRVASVPASTHPPLAAWLAALADPHAGELVCDPFCGAGLELIECGLRCPGAKLLGRDRDAAALDAARQNAAAAGVTLETALAPSSEALPSGINVLITNPPMGRRVRQRDGDGPSDNDLNTLLRPFVAQAAAALAPGGRLVWASPLPALTRAWATNAGLRCREHHAVDMGGFGAEVQVFVRVASGR